MKLYKEDIKKIGNTTSQTDDGGTSFICNVDTANIEEILLRNILELFGDYKILSSEDFIWESDHDIVEWDLIDIEFKTNLPWEIYMSL